MQIFATANPFVMQIRCLKIFKSVHKSERLANKIHSLVFGCLIIKFLLNLANFIEEKVIAHLTAKSSTTKNDQKINEMKEAIQNYPIIQRFQRHI